MIRSSFLSILIVTLVIILGNAQTRQDAEEIYRDANAYFYFEDYEEALALYLSIYDEFPDNANLDYRIGICYSNIAGSKDRAISYLERASQNISNRYSESSIREKRAPIDALFYLGNAYFANNELDKATWAYEEFRSNIRRERQYDIDYLNHQVEAIERSRVIQRYPVNFLRSNLGSDINNRFSNYNPVISGNGKTLAYTTNERFYQAIMVATKEGDRWGRPRNITLDLMVDGNCTTLSLSYDGTELYLFKDDDHVGNIYVTRLVEGSWTPMRKLNENINTEFYETHASVTGDGKKLYFASNRMGGFGDLDIYVSERTKNGDWGPAKILGAPINTRFNENTPFITTDGKTLFFSSDGHHGVGGYDIFFSNLKADGTWSQPVNLGFPINTADDNLFYQPIGDGGTGLMAVFDPHGFGEKDITQIEIFLPKYQRSIVTLDDFYARRSELPPRTLVVDTVNVEGVALIDPTRSEYINYLASDVEYTLFFDGKSYDLKDQTEELTKQKEKTGDVLLAEEVVQAKPVEYPTEKLDKLPDDIDEDSFESTPQPIESIESEGLKVDFSIDAEKVTPTQDDEASGIASDLRKEVYGIDSENPQSLRFRELLALLGDPSLKGFLDSTLAGNLDGPADLRFLTIRRMALRADSLGKTQGVIEAFAKLMDLLSVNAVEVKYRQSRRISQTSYDEDFFFRLQRLKRMASPQLAALLDEAILNNPNIASFASLWHYLVSSKYDQVKPYLPEFLSLLAEATIDGFFGLGESEQDGLVVAAQGKKIKVVKLYLVVGIMLIAGLFAIVLIRRRRRKAK